jgi:hypothetical protein
MLRPQVRFLKNILIPYVTSQNAHASSKMIKSIFKKSSNKITIQSLPSFFV